MISSLRRQLLPLEVFRACTCLNLHSGILQPYLVTQGFSPLQAITVLAVVSIATVVVLLPSGHWADKYGQVKCLAAGCLCMIIGMTLWATTTGFGPLVLTGSLLLGVGWSSLEGPDYAVASRICAGDDYRAHQNRVIRVSVFAIGGGGVLSLAFLSCAATNFVVSLVLAWVLEKHGLSPALMLSGCVSCCLLSISLGAAFITRHTPRPGALGLPLDDSPADS